MFSITEISSKLQEVEKRKEGNNAELGKSTRLVRAQLGSCSQAAWDMGMDSRGELHTTSSLGVYLHPYGKERRMPASLPFIFIFPPALFFYT